MFNPMDEEQYTFIIWKELKNIFCEDNVWMTSGCIRIFNQFGYSDYNVEADYQNMVIPPKVVKQICKDYIK